MVSLLLQQHGIINPFLSSHKSVDIPLTIAFIKGHTEVVRALISYDSSPAHINYQDKYGCTTLYWASKENKIDVVSLLLEQHGINSLLSRREDGAIPLTIASYEGHTEVVRALLDFDSSPAHLNYQEKDGTTALYLASHENEIEIVRLLIGRGADLTIKSTTNNRMTALEVARSKGHDECARLIQVT